MAERQPGRSRLVQILLGKPLGSLEAMKSAAAAISQLSELAASGDVRKLSEAFSVAGRELALVGGSIRDAFLDRPMNDLDFTTDADPDTTLAILAGLTKTTWDVGRAFGTIGAKLSKHTVEITTYRADAYDGETRKPSVQFGTSLEQDLLRRDFKVNAMALRLPDLQLVDPSGGIDDLLHERLSTPGSAEDSFTDDPLRMLRAARFCSQLGFQVADEVRVAMSALGSKLEIVSAERIRDELSRLLCTPEPRTGLDLLVSTGIADLVIPEIPALKLQVDEHHRHKDVYEHSLTVLDQAIELEQSRHPDSQPDLVLRLAALLHDIGKPATRRFETGGAVSFHHHDLVGAKLAGKRLRELRFDKPTITAVSRLIELHLRFFGYSDSAWTDSAVRRYVRDAGDLLERLHILTRADVTTRNRKKAERLEFAYDDLESRISELAEQEELASIRPDLDGSQIMKILNIPAGPLVGEAYRFLLETRLNEGPLEPKEAEHRLKEWFSNR